MWQPLDSEKPLADYSPAAEMPDVESVRAGLVVPEVPEELPAVAGLLERLAQLPWTPGLSNYLVAGAVADLVPLPHQDQAP